MKQEILEQLATSLGVTVEKLWAALIAQAPISATVDFVVWLPLLLCANYWIYRSWKSLIKSEDDASPAIVALIIASIIMLVLSLCWIGDLPNNVAAFTNPDFWALRKIISMVKT